MISEEQREEWQKQIASQERETAMHLYDQQQKPTVTYPLTLFIRVYEEGDEEFLVNMNAIVTITDGDDKETVSIEYAVGTAVRRGLVYRDDLIYGMRESRCP